MTKMKKQRYSIDDRIAKTNFNFTKNLKWFLIPSGVIILVGIILLCTLGFNLGFDFTGGTNMTIFMNYNSQTGDKYLSDYDVCYNTDNSAEYSEACNIIEEVLNEYGLTASSFQKTTITISADKNYSYTVEDGNAIIVKFQNSDTDDVTAEDDLIRVSLLKAFGYLGENATTADLDTDDAAALVANGGVTTASASSQLLMKSFLALLVAVVLILIYVAFRFELTSGFAAIFGLFHDILITCSIMLICRIEINTSFIAALITILGYSINNTIIIFDRIREELKMKKNLGKIDNNEIANGAVKGTMMRSLLTTITTFIMIFFITVIGVSDIREFAFPIMIGILCGFYSSVFITPGLWAIAYRPSKKKIAKMKEKEAKKLEPEQYEI